MAQLSIKGRLLWSPAVNKNGTLDLGSVADSLQWNSLKNNVAWSKMKTAVAAALAQKDAR